MPSLLDFLGAGGQGLLGSFGGGGSFYNPQDEAEAARQAAATALAARFGRRGEREIDQAFPTQVPGLASLSDLLFPPPAAAGNFPSGASIPFAPQSQPSAMPSAMAPGGIAPTRAPMQTVPVSLPMGQPAAVPAPAPAPAARAPMPPAAAPAVQPQAPGLGDRLSAGFTGFANSAGPLPAIANLIGGLATGQRQDPAGVAQQNQILTARAIYGGLLKTHSPEEAKAIALASVANPDVAKAVLPDLFGNKPSGMFKVGGMELPYKIEGGQMRVLLPDGGTHGLSSLADFTALSDKIAAESARSKAAATKVGESQGEAQQALPGALERSNNLISQIDALLKHPGKATATGPLAGAAPALAGDQADYIARLGQVKGALTQEGIQAMQGAGLRITQAEANLFAQAGGRLERRAGAQNVDNALREVRDRLVRAQALTAQKAGVAAPTAPTQQSMGTDPLGIR